MTFENNQIKVEGLPFSLRVSGHETRKKFSLSTEVKQVKNN